MSPKTTLKLSVPLANTEGAESQHLVVMKKCASEFSRFFVFCTLIVAAAGWQPNARGQSDDFNDGKRVKPPWAPRTVSKLPPGHAPLRGDDGWVHLDLSPVKARGPEEVPSHPTAPTGALRAAASLPASTFSFPNDGSGGKAYRIFSPAPRKGA